MGSISANRYFNDPNIAAAFSNLAGLYAPPSGSDLAGYATASATKEKAARLADFYSKALDPSTTRDQLDRMGLGSGSWNPTQSFYSVDQGNAVTMRGQDVTATTSRLNNADDNAGAMARQQLVQDALTQNKALDRSNDVTLKMLDPVAEGATRFVPPTIADLYKVDQNQTGVLSANQGETLVSPDGRVIKGADKPLSETEVVASILQSLPANEQRAVALGSTPVENIIAPDGKTPQVAWRADSVGQTPWVNKGADAKPTNYRTPDGKQGTAVVGPTGALIDTQTQQALPEGTVTFGTNVQGSLSDTGLSTTSNQTAATDLDAQIVYSKDRLAQYRKLLTENPGITGVPGYVRGLAQDLRSGLNEMVASYGEDASFKSPEEVQVWLDKLATSKNYDPNIAIAASMALDMAYVDAKLHDPSGEVNVREMQQYLDKYDGGLAGNAKVLANLQDLDAQIVAREQQVGKLRNPASTPAQTEGAAEVWDFVDGKLQRVK